MLPDVETLMLALLHISQGAFALLMAIVANFISSTVAAIIIVPVVAQVSEVASNADVVSLTTICMKVWKGPQACSSGHVYA